VRNNLATLAYVDKLEWIDELRSTKEGVEGEAWCLPTLRGIVGGMRGSLSPMSVWAAPRQFNECPMAIGPRIFKGPLQLHVHHTNPSWAFGGSA